MNKAIEDELANMQGFLEEPIPDDLNMAIERGKELLQYQARSGYIMVEFKREARKKKKDEIGEMIKQLAGESNLSSKAQNSLVDTYASDELFLSEWANRINSGCTHQLDFLRTLISKAKAEMQFQNL